MTLKEFADEIYASYERDKDTNFVFFLGAGCSKSSGIPLASELALEWFFKLRSQESKFSYFVDEHIKDESYSEEAKKISKEEDISPGLYEEIVKLYFSLFEKLFPDMIDRQKEIQRLTEGKYPGLGYYQLAELMRYKAFNVVITTNFDDLIHDALLYSNQKRRARVISHYHLAQFIDRGDTPHIIKLHGDAHLQPFNDHKNTQEIDEVLAESVKTLLTNAKLIVIGYGGGDRSIAKLLESVPRQGKVYWCNKNTPEETELKEWWEKLEYKEHVEEFDFDKIMNMIGEKFELDTPDFEGFARTLKSKYDASLKKESEEAIEKSEFEELMRLLTQSRRAGNYREGLELALKAKDSIESQTEEKNTKRAKLYDQIGNFYNHLGKDDKAIEYHEKALEIELEILGENHPDTATSYNNLGSAWHSRGDYDKAIEYYEKALEILKSIFPDGHPNIDVVSKNLESIKGEG
jgi:NAD-dependent SIR2 family protein deacetylase